MGDVVPIRKNLEHPERNPRSVEASLLRRVIEERRIAFGPGEGERAATKVDSFIDRHHPGGALRSVTAICERIWPRHGNPAQRRRDLRAVKKPTKLKDY